MLLIVAEDLGRLEVADEVLVDELPHRLAAALVGVVERVERDPLVEPRGRLVAGQADGGHVLALAADGHEPGVAAVQERGLQGRLAVEIGGRDHHVEARVGQAQPLGHLGRPLDHQDLQVGRRLQRLQHAGQDVLGRDDREEGFLVGVLQVGERPGVDHRRDADLDRPDLGRERGDALRLEAIARRGGRVGRDEPRGAGAVGHVQQSAEELGHAEPQVGHPERHGRVAEHPQRLEGRVELDLGLLGTAVRAVGIIHQAAQVDQGQRPLPLGAEEVGEDHPADQSAELARGASAWLGIADHLAGDHQHPRQVVRPSGQRLRLAGCPGAVGLRDVGLAARHGGRRRGASRAADHREGRRRQDDGGDREPPRGEGSSRRHPCRAPS